MSFFSCGPLSVVPPLAVAIGRIGHLGIAAFGRSPCYPYSVLLRFSDGSPGGEWRQKKATVRDAVGSVLGKFGDRANGRELPSFSSFFLFFFAHAVLPGQLKENGDLSRISLPAVFSYPYSALELGMFRGLRFSELLFEAAKEKDPVERLAKVLAFCSTSGENTPFNKKPLNPVHGEELTCWTFQKDGSRTVFRAEQVSHHPPVSAFYMFSEASPISFECNVEMTPVFHGNSATIATKGFGEVKLGGETYQLSKYVPDLRIESCVFGTRRQVWRGEWELTCKETGLAVVLNFSENKQSAGWFGGGEYVNEVSGFAYQLSDEKKAPVATFSGLAGERLVMQRPKEKEKAIMDFKTLKAQEVHFMAYNRTPPNDSLRIWNKVTAAIVADDMKKADQAKSVVEDNARKLRKEREATDKPLIAKYFAMVGDRWTHTEQTTNLMGVFDSDGGVSTTNGNGTLDDTDASTLNRTEVSDSEGDRSYL